MQKVLPNTCSKTKHARVRARGCHFFGVPTLEYSKFRRARESQNTHLHSNNQFLSFSAVSFHVMFALLSFFLVVLPRLRVSTIFFAIVLLQIVFSPVLQESKNRKGCNAEGFAKHLLKNKARARVRTRGCHFRCSNFRNVPSFVVLVKVGTRTLAL